MSCTFKLGMGPKQEKTQQTQGRQRLGRLTYECTQCGKPLHMTVIFEHLKKIHNVSQYKKKHSGETFVNNMVRPWQVTFIS